MEQPHSSFILLAWLIAAAALATGLPARAAESVPYFAVTGPCDLRFPEDHGAHPGYKTEWWYYTGNLKSENGDPFGFQLTFFRSQLSPSGSERTWPEPASAWRTQQLFLAHAALSDVRSERFHHAEQMGRGALGLAGAEQEAGVTSVFVKEWSARLGPATHRLVAGTPDFSYELRLTPEKDPVPHGQSGYSLKGRKPESASCYYSFTRFRAEGTVTVAGKSIPVRGTAWMDHEFSSAPLEEDISGWDWFSLQFDDHTELMVYLLRHKDGGMSPASSGTFVATSGEATHLPIEAITVDVLDQWKSPHSQARYPSGWRLRIAPLQLDVTVTPNLDDQEMSTPETTRVTYWEGSVSVEGTAQGRPLTGVGYVELTGYAQPLTLE